jgi:hypothetical protein
MTSQREFPMTVGELLEQAAVVVASRHDAYGEPVELFQQIARRWSLTLGIQISPVQVALCMIDLKLARLVRNPNHVDSIVDIAGYAGVWAEVLGDA